ncbi:MAG: hypothetical protein JWQ35_1196 [Bacteriovoracaceae bacterium]|nr:hypothetical protein [Bacteriovoracaceae bacterium]
MFISNIFTSFLVSVLSVTNLPPAATVPTAPERETVYAGRLRVPVFAIGGETTGIGFETAGTTVELVLTKDVKQALSNVVDKTVIRISGKDTTLSGVETHDRPAIDVDSVTLFSHYPTFQGVMKNVMAIGGETTGYVIAIKNQARRLELDLPKDLIENAKALIAKSAEVKVSGILEHYRGVEIPIRWIITVQSLEEVLPVSK